MRLIICFMVAIFALCVGASDPQGTRSFVNRLVPSVGPVNGGRKGLQNQKIEQIDDGNHQQTTRHHHTGHHQNKVTKINDSTTQPPVKFLDAVGGGGSSSAPSTGGSATLIGLAKRAHLLRRGGGKKKSSSSTLPVQDLANKDLIHLKLARQKDANPQGSHNKAAASGSSGSSLMSKKLVGLSDGKTVAAQKAAGQKPALINMAPGSQTITEVNPPNIASGPLQVTNKSPKHEA